MDAADRAELERLIRERFDAGDFAAAATAAIRGYGPELFGFLIGLAGDVSQIASDAFAAFCADLWRDLPRFRWESTFRTWAYMIARATSSTGRRASAARRRREVTPSEVAGGRGAGGADPHRHARAPAHRDQGRLRRAAGAARSGRPDAPGPPRRQGPGVARRRPHPQRRQGAGRARSRRRGPAQALRAREGAAARPGPRGRADGRSAGRARAVELLVSTPGRRRV
ncbi:MAG: sigma-70 family RNA polymerase sigma factor [Kofleriaceae bacterium]|nr:sigma-70 family RNA polymerase sigma factor [Kofleriaceae bacterium]